MSESFLQRGVMALDRAVSFKFNANRTQVSDLEPPDPEVIAEQQRLMLGFRKSIFVLMFASLIVQIACNNKDRPASFPVDTAEVEACIDKEFTLSSGDTDQVELKCGLDKSDDLRRMFLGRLRSLKTNIRS